MKDIFFFPLIFAVALAIIAAAALPGKDRVGCTAVSGAISGYSEIVVAGDDLCRMETTGQAELNQVVEDGAIQSLLITAGAGLLGDRPDRNPHFLLAADLENVFAGRKVIVTIEARTLLDWGALAFEATYFAGQEGGSGWKQFNLTPEYKEYTFEWDVPQRLVCEQAFDYVAIRPVVPDKQRTVEIRSVTMRPVGPIPPPSKACTQ